MIKDSVEITEDIRNDEEQKIPIRYFSVSQMKYHTIQSCEGDLIVICNALADYAQLLSEYLESEKERLNLCGQYQYEYHIERCLKIQKFLEQEIGYSRDEAILKCMKRKKYNRDIGEEALVLAVRKNNATTVAESQKQ